jgi:hypothetical protein
VQNFSFIAIDKRITRARGEDKSTNSWTTIAFIEGLACDIRRTLSVSIRNACFYWIISKLIAQSFSRNPAFEISSIKNQDALSCFLRDVAKEKSFPENIFTREMIAGASWTTSM